LAIADQLSKHWVRTNLTLGVPYNPVNWLRPIFSLTYVTNTGAAFGIFPRLGSSYILVYLIVIGVILASYRTLAADRRWLQLSFGMQLAGALGNLLDRLRMAGRVTDFLDLNFWPLQNWPVFNVADSSVVVGVCIMAVYLLLEAPLESSDQEPDNL